MSWVTSSMLHFYGDVVVEPEELKGLSNTFEKLYEEYTINEHLNVSYMYDEEKDGMEKGRGL